MLLFCFEDTPLFKLVPVGPAKYRMLAYANDGYVCTVWDRLHAADLVKKYRYYAPGWTVRYGRKGA